MEQVKELLSQLKLFCRLDVAFTEKLEEHDSRLYRLEEDNKRNTAAIRSLEKRYSELLYAFRSVKDDMK